MSRAIVHQWDFSVAIDDNPMITDPPAEEGTESRHVTLTVKSSRTLLLTPTETPSDDSVLSARTIAAAPAPLRQFLTNTEGYLSDHFSRLCLILDHQALRKVAGKTRQAIIESPNGSDVRLIVSIRVNLLMKSPEAIKRHILAYTANFLFRNDSSSEVLAAKSLDYVEEEEEELCPICLEELQDIPEDDRRVMRTPCSHLYHERCIGRWLKISCKCPLCRYEMPGQKSVAMVSLI